MAETPERIGEEDHQRNLYELVEAKDQADAAKKTRFKVGTAAIITGHIISSAGGGKYMVVPVFDVQPDSIVSPPQHDTVARKSSTNDINMFLRQQRKKK